MVIHNSFADFVLFLYVHMAHADGDFHETELSMVREKMPKLYHPEEVDLDVKLKKVIDEYNSIEKSELNKLFRDTFDHFRNVRFDQKYKVYTDLYDIIKADGKVLEAETKALKELKEIIDINAEVSH